MLYENYETEISKNVLGAVLTNVAEPVCLLGGWAVYLAVNQRYSRAHGVEYHGSKDIDLGFHFSDTESAESVQQSTFAKSIKSLEQMGFTSVSYRMAQAYSRETRRSLSAREARKVPIRDLFYLYVDPIVDKIPGDFKDAMGFQPIDEPLLQAVFTEGQYDEIHEFGAKIMLPKPDILLATKIAALPKREKDHKKHKDIADIYALIWYSGAALRDLQRGVLHYVSADDVKNALLDIGDKEYEATANALDADANMLKNIIDSFARSCMNAGTEHPDDQDPNKWTMPFNVGYETFVQIPQSLLRQKTNSEPVSYDKLAQIATIAARAIKSNMDFLKSVKVVTGITPTSCRLTKLGLAYAEAHASGDKNAIKQASLEMINNSHLKNLADAIDANKEHDLGWLYGWIKTAGGYPDGKSASGMHAPNHTGARSLLRVFQDAGLLADDLLDIRASRPKPTRTPGLGSLSVAGIGHVEINDADTLAIAESYMEMLRKKLATKTPDRVQDGD